MKLVVVCSSLDISVPLSATPAWWQLLKGLYEVGVDLAVTTYHGPAFESPWWRSYPNPARHIGDAHQRVRSMLRRVAPGATADRSGQGWFPRLELRLAQTVVSPRWHRHLDRILRREHPVDAVLFVNAPPNHLRGVAARLRQRHGVPVLLYDGDVPASLPDASGFATGFRIYDGADLSEFDAVLCNSVGGAPALRALGARAVHVLHYGADPSLYAPRATSRDIDVFFYGHTAEYRAEWIRAMIERPSIALPSLDFAVRGVGLGPLGRARLLEGVPFSQLRHLVARSRLNLVITRSAHAGVYGSSTMRPFELAMMGACIVSNPYQGLEDWFEPGRELIVVHSEEEAVDRYRYLIAHDTEREAIGQAARRRALASHTFAHRAAELVGILRQYA